MMPQAVKQLAPLLAQAAGSFASGQAVAQYAVPAVATKSAGLFGGKRVSVPLSEPLPGVSVPKYVAPAAAKVEAGAIEGVKAAAVDAAGPNVAVALFVGAGSANETPETAGASKLLEYLAFSATANRSTFRLTRELEKYGAAAAALAGREAIAYGVEGTRLQVAEVTEILLDAVLNMRLNYWEINDMLPHVQADMERAYAQPTVLATELLHRAAFSGGLAQPLMPDPESLSGLTPEAVHAFVAAHFTADNMALAVAGAGMGALSNAAGPLVAAGAKRGGGGGGGAAGKYTGGVISALAPSMPPIVALAYQAPGGLSDAKSTALAAVLKALLNETREAMPYMHKEPAGALGSVMPVVHVYKSTGLIGLLGTPSGGAAAAVDAMSSRFEALAKGAPEPALAAAKAVALGGYRAATATKSGAVQDLAQQLLARGTAGGAGEYAAAVAALTAADVAAAAGAMVKGPPTLVAAGPLSDLPKYDAVARRFA
ncbi:MAG: mitochondrial processing peptidase alpha subunit [Monoraphidium minutum]|nr:MAG: mitochondrial processing peptidase alpha subunit [Monoraphidium minutum]